MMAIRKIRILLQLCLLFLIIINLDNNSLLAQEQRGTRDPFLSLDDKRELGQKPIDIASLPYPVELQGIIWTKELRLAVVNNETVEENQDWREFKVKRIEKEKVILGLGSNNFEIPLNTEEKDEEKKD